jgi:hypothetical protein
MKTPPNQFSQSESLAALAEQVEEDAIAITRLRSDMHLMRMIDMGMRQNLSQGSVVSHKRLELFFATFGRFERRAVHPGLICSKV